MENTKTYRTDEDISALADICVQGNDDEAKSMRLAALYKQYGTCLDELIERAIEKAEKFVKCPVCERDDNCMCCGGEGKITKEKYNKLINIIGKL